MAKVKVNGYELDYTDDGGGEPVVFVHGALSDRRIWEGQRSVLSEGFRVIVYSRRYHWPNESIVERAEYGMLEQVEDLEGLIGTLELAPAHLVGNSYGAFICLMVAIRRPKLVRSLALAEPPVIPLFASFPPKPLELLRLLITRPRAAVALFRFAATGIRPSRAAFERGDYDEGVRIFAEAVLGPKGYELMTEERVEQMRVNDFPEQFLGDGFVPLTAEEVRNVLTPTLLMTGEHSQSFLVHLIDRLEELLPHNDRVEIPGASHDMQVDNPEAFNVALRSFLTKIT